MAEDGNAARQMEGPDAPGDPIRTLVVDDAEVMRKSICSYLEALRTIDVVGTAGDGRQALLQTESLRPDLVLMDVEMPGMNGLTATARLKELHPGVKVIIVTVYDGPEFQFVSRECGADGFVSKARLSRELPSELRRIFSVDHRARGRR